MLLFSFNEKILKSGKPRGTAETNARMKAPELGFHISFSVNTRRELFGTRRNSSSLLLRAAGTFRNSSSLPLRAAGTFRD